MSRKIAEKLRCSLVIVLMVSYVAVGWSPSRIAFHAVTKNELNALNSAKTAPSQYSEDKTLNNMDSNSSMQNRRNVLFRSVGILSTIFTTSTFISVPEPAMATYSAYAHREQDWEERVAKGEIQIKTSRDLRKQLQEIAPMNSEKSKIFCPNGPSAAVSPLMENKCGDRMASPSVYGRTEDSVGNSIPGFTGGLYSSDVLSGTTNLAAELSSVKYATNSGKK